MKIRGNTVIVIENYNNHIKEYEFQFNENKFLNILKLKFEEQKIDLLGTFFSIEEGNIVNKNFLFEDYNILEILSNKCEIRNQQGLPTILLFDNLTLKQKSRIENIFNEKKIEFIFIKEPEDLKYIEFSLNQLPSDQIDIVGDIHGLYDEFINFISQLGYIVIDKTIYHPEGRKLLFLGDLIDRGLKSIDMLELVSNSVKNGHYCICGNHEYKILQFYKHYEKFKNVKSVAFSSSNTISDLLKLEEADFLKYIKFILSLETYYTYKDIAMVHANIEYFKPNNVINSHLIFGSGKDEHTDEIYQKLYDEKKNEYTLIRGHYIQSDLNKYENIFSLEMEQAFAGYLAILPLDGFLKDRETMSNKESFNKNLKKFKVDYNYKDNKRNIFLLKEIQNMLKNKEISIYQDNRNILNHIKSNNNLNGIIYAFNGDIISRPNTYIEYNKDFNENDYTIIENISSNNEVSLSYNPYEKDILFTTNKYLNDKNMYDKFSFEDKNKLIEILKKHNYTIIFQYYRDCFYLSNINLNDINLNIMNDIYTKNFYLNNFKDIEKIKLLNRLSNKFDLNDFYNNRNYGFKNYTILSKNKIYNIGSFKYRLLSFLINYKNGIFFNKKSIEEQHLISIINNLDINIKEFDVIKLKEIINQNF